MDKVKSPEASEWTDSECFLILIWFLTAASQIWAELRLFCFCQTPNLWLHLCAWTTSLTSVLCNGSQQRGVNCVSLRASVTAVFPPNTLIAKTISYKSDNRVLMKSTQTGAVLTAEWKCFPCDQTVVLLSTGEIIRQQVCDMSTEPVNVLKEGSSHSLIFPVGS